MEINKHTFILLANYSANTLGQIRSLGERGIMPIAVLINKNSFRIDKSRYLKKIYNVSAIEEGLNLIISLYGNEKYKPFLYTDSDAVMGVLDSHWNELNDKFILWNAGTQGRLNIYLNKIEQIKLAEECGFNIPKTEVVKIGEFPKTLNYPVFSKAMNSLTPWWKGYAYICNNKDDLEVVFKKIRDTPKIILQEYIQKKEELPIEGISLRGGEEIRLLGRTVYYRLLKDSFGSYRYVEPFENKELETKIKTLIKRFQYTGPFQIEFIIDKDNIAYYLETNFRIAQQDYAFTKLGANIPYLFAISTLYNHIVENEIHYNTKRKSSIMNEFEDFKNSVLHRRISLFQWIKDVQHADCFQFYNKQDMMPFYWTLFSKITNSFKKKLSTLLQILQ